MVDALDLEHIERAPDVGRRPLLAGMRHQAGNPVRVARANTRANFFGGWPTSLDARPMPRILSRGGSACSRHSNSLGLTQVAQETQDQ